MYALISQGFDPDDKPANIVAELFPDDPHFHEGLDIRPVQAGTQLGWIAHDDGTIAAYVAPDKTVEQLTEYATAKRWQIETGGVTVSGMPVATDDRSKQMIMGARIAATADSTFTAQWAVGPDVFPLSATQIIAISDAVLAHVNRCFAAFAEVSALIKSGAMLSTTQIDAAFEKVKA